MNDKKVDLENINILLDEFSNVISVLNSNGFALYDIIEREKYIGKIRRLKRELDFHVSMFEGMD